jgi:hypothetical protein
MMELMRTTGTALVYVTHGAMLSPQITFAIGGLESLSSLQTPRQRSFDHFP